MNAEALPNFSQCRQISKQVVFGRCCVCGGWRRIRVWGRRGLRLRRGGVFSRCRRAEGRTENPSAVRPKAIAARWLLRQETGASDFRFGAADDALHFAATRVFSSGSRSRQAESSWQAKRHRRERTRLEGPRSPRDRARGRAGRDRAWSAPLPVRNRLPGRPSAPAGGNAARPFVRHHCRRSTPPGCDSGAGAAELPSVIACPAGRSRF
jgi:hypothetical protein